LNIEYSRPVIFTNLFEVAKFAKEKAHENFGFYSNGVITCTCSDYKYQRLFNKV